MLLVIGREARSNNPDHHSLGATVDGDKLPFSVRGTGALRGGPVTIDASGSSQFVSGLLLSAARFERGVTVHHDGAALPSMPHIEMTVQMLRQADVQITAPSDPRKAQVWTVEPGIYIPGFGGVRIEDDVVVTQSGIDILTHSTKDLLVLG